MIGDVDERGWLHEGKYYLNWLTDRQYNICKYGKNSKGYRFGLFFNKTPIKFSNKLSELQDAAEEHRNAEING